MLEAVKSTVNPGPLHIGPLLSAVTVQSQLSTVTVTSSVMEQPLKVTVKV